MGNTGTKSDIVDRLVSSLQFAPIVEMQSHVLVHCYYHRKVNSDVARIWRWEGRGGLGNGSPPVGPGAEPLVDGSGGGIASRKLIAVIKDIWLPNHAQFCVFSSTAQPGIFL